MPRDLAKLKEIVMADQAKKATLPKDVLDKMVADQQKQMAGDESLQARTEKER